MQQKAKPALKNSEEQLRLLVDEAKEYAIFLLDPGGRVVSWNSGAAQIKGYKTEEIVGRNFSCFYTPEDIARSHPQRELLRAEAEGCAKDEGWRVRKDGSRFWANVVITALRDEAGQLQGFGKVTRDFTERKRAEDELRESENKFHGLFNWVGEAIQLCELIYDEQGCPADVLILDVNSAYEKHTGIRREQVVGRRIKEILPVVEQAWLDRYGDIVRTRTGAHFEEYNASLGKWFEVHAYADPMNGKRFAAIFSDTTDRKGAKERLRESEERFRTMANSIPQLAWVAKADGFIHWYNRRWYEYTGTTPEQMEGWGWQSVHDPATLPKVLEQWKRSIATGNPFDMVFPLRGADGRFRPFLTRVMPLTDSAGQVVQWFGTNTDVSERMKIEEALRESEEHYRTLFETMSQGVIYQDTDGKIVAMNPAAERILGMAQAELLGEISVGMEQRTLREDGSPYPEMEHPSMVSLRTGARLRNVVMCVYNPREKGYRWISIDSVPLFREGAPQPYQAYTIFDDVTDRMRAEQERTRLATIVMNSDDAIVSKGLDGIVQSWNFGAQRLFGYTAEEIIGRPLSLLFPPGQEGEEDDIQRRLKAGERIENYETVRLTKEQQRIEVSVTDSPLTDARGQIIGTSIIARDISVRKRKDAEVRHLLNELEKQVAAVDNAEAANRAKSVFVANMSHELRSPLNVILGFSRLMADDPQVTADQGQKLKLIVRSGENLLRLINNVLDIAKIEADRVELEQTQFDLHQALHETHSMMQVRAVEKGLSFSIALSTDLPRYVTTDSGKLNQVLVNLIGNAIKFTKTGGVILRARAENVQSPQRALVRFEIEDSGPGIRAADQQRIFAPFVQLPDHPPAEAGSGLGLVISEQHVKLMGGRIAVTSEVGKGSIFRFDIPVAVALQSAEDIPVDPQPGRITGIAAGQQRYRLLIAEDSPDNRLLLRTILERLGLDIREAVNGQDAVAQHEAWHPHLIWMDIRMPIMNGLDATRRIRESNAGGGTKIIAVTAHALEDERKEILAAGCDDFIRKPYAESAIFGALAKHLGVRFAYAEKHSLVADSESSEGSLAQLEKLPPGLLQELRDAAVLLDGPRCLEIATRIDDDEGELRGWLRRMVDNLQYAELLHLLDEAYATRPV